MSNNKTIKSALISVFSKDGLEPIVKQLDAQGVTIYSTGGTQKFINDLGIDVVPAEDITSYPSILGGRVKTLHPKIFGGILNRQDNAQDVAELVEFEIPQIDAVIVDVLVSPYLHTENVERLCKHVQFPWGKLSGLELWRELWLGSCLFVGRGGVVLD